MQKTHLNVFVCQVLNAHSYTHTCRHIDVHAHMHQFRSLAYITITLVTDEPVKPFLSSLPDWSRAVRCAREVPRGIYMGGRDELWVIMV